MSAPTLDGPLETAMSAALSADFPAPAGEGAWIEVIQQMDRVYGELVDSQTALEDKNTELEAAQAFIASVMGAMSDLLIVLGAELLSPKVLMAASPDMKDDLSILNGTSGTLKERVEAIEAKIMREALIRHRWNKSKAARELGLSRVGLRGKLERYGLQEEAEDDTLLAKS